jgi:hypothetical protein
MRRHDPERADRRVIQGHREAMCAGLLECLGHVIEIDGGLEPQ